MGPEHNYWLQTMGRRLARRDLLRAGALGAGVVGLSTIGCGSSSKSGGSASNAQPAAAPSAAAAGGPAVAPAAGNFKTGGTLQLQFDGQIALDPYQSNSYRTQILASHSYSRLFRFVTGTEPSVFQSHQVVGDLVDSYEVGAGGLSYTMKLKRNAMFHPPLSRPLTSADVLASYERFTTDPKSTNAGVLKPIVNSLTAPDDSTLVFKLKIPYAPFLNLLATPLYFWVMPKEAWGEAIDPVKQMVGTGPFIYVNGTPTAYTFKKNPDFFIKGIPYADGAVLNIAQDYATREAQFQAGRIDLDNFPVSDTDAMKKAVPKANIVTFTRNLLSFIFFTNVSDPASPFHDVRMRRAVSLAVDRQGILDIGYNGKGAWNNVINAGMGKWWLDPQGKDIGDAGKWYKHDPAQAKQLLAAAGHAGTEFKFLYPNNAYSEPYNTIADAVRGMLADAGFKLTVVTVDYQKDYMNSGQGIFYKGAPPNTIVYALQSSFSDPDDYLTGMLTPGGNRNHSKVDDPNLTALLKKEQAEVNETKRVDLVKQIQKLASDQMYYAPGVGSIRSDFYQSWVDNRFVTEDYSYGLERTAYLSLEQIMTKYFAQRLLLVLPTIAGVTVIVFAIVRLVPGGVESVLLGQDATPDQAAKLHHALGLDRPIWLQYLQWIGGVLHGDMGQSILNHTPVAHDIAQRIGWTFELGTFALLFSLLIALPIGVLSAVRQDSPLDYLARSAAITFVAVPSFWLATMLIVYGSIGLDLGGISLHFTPPLGREIDTSLDTNLRLVIPPALILGIGLSGPVMRLTRTQMLEVMRQDYIRTAQAKGLHIWSVIARHALRNALIPVITIIGLQVPVLVGGSVILEQIFSLPGIGFYLVNAVSQRDLTVIQGVVLISATIVIVSNLMVDLLYTFLDPRLRAA